MIDGGDDFELCLGFGSERIVPDFSLWDIGIYQMNSWV